MVSAISCCALCGLRPGTAEESLHSPEELKLLVQASQEAGILQPAQQELVERVLSIGEPPHRDIMTPRRDVDWIDADDTQDEMLRTIRECRHEQLLVGRGGIDEPLGMILKRDLLDQVLDGKPLDPMAVIREPADRSRDDADLQSARAVQEGAGPPGNRHRRIWQPRRHRHPDRSP